MQASRAILLGLSALFAAVALYFWANPAPLKKAAFSQAMPVDYFAPYEESIPPALYQVQGPIYAYEHGFTRSLIIVTDGGIAVFDTFDEAHAHDMKAALAEQFPGNPVRWVVYSHNHLDHLRGSDVFSGAEVIGHTLVNDLVADWPEAGKSIAPVTRAIEGDTVLQFGPVTVDALYMTFSHSHTLYGFHVRDHDVVFAADMMFVKAVPPFDFPDFYHPGYIRALDRLIALNAAHYVPSHMDRGTRDDLIAFRDMMVKVEATIRGLFLTHGEAIATDGYIMRQSLRDSYDVLAADYGDWHGFDAMFVPKFGRHWGGAYLGY
ncbi:MAG: MBL fold metallo-hydrolase [Alphaproteobacteria bacterium]